MQAKSNLIHLLAASLLLALTPPSSAEVEPAHAKLIEELLELNQTQAAYERSITSDFAAQMQGTGATLPEAQRTKFDRAITRIQELFQAELGWDTVRPTIIEQYAQAFSVEQLQNLLPILRSPEMQHYLQLSTTLKEAMGLSINDSMQRLQPAITKIVQEEMSKP
jgi:hypothetical protein